MEISEGLFEELIAVLSARQFFTDEVGAIAEDSEIIEMLAKLEELKEGDKA